MDLNEYQARALQTDLAPAVSGSDVLVPLLGLSGEVGELLSEYKKHLRDGEAHRLFSSRVEEELGDILWYVAAVGSRFDLDLESIAQRNLAKCADHWSRTTIERSVVGRFDAAFPTSERFPAHFVVRFEESDSGAGLTVRAFLEDRQLGQPLTDNAYDDDGYRFHDIFHLGFVAGLGWSPVTRRNLGWKRRSDPRVDEVEDGGRAIVIEEGISALVFRYAMEHDWLRGITRIDHDLLKTIKRMTAHLEAAECSVAEWENTILMSYPVWDSVVQRRGGERRG